MTCLELNQPLMILKWTILSPSQIKCIFFLRLSCTFWWALWPMGLRCNQLFTNNTTNYMYVSFNSLIYITTTPTYVRTHTHTHTRTHRFSCKLIVSSRANFSCKCSKRVKLFHYWHSESKKKKKKNKKISEAHIQIGDSNSNSTQTRGSSREVMLEECLTE